MSTSSKTRPFVSDTDLRAPSTAVQTEGDQAAMGLAAYHGLVVCHNAVILWALKVGPLLWTDLMVAAGFVDWPLVPDLRLGTSLVAATMVAGVISMAVIYHTPRPRPRLLLIFRATATVVALLGFVTILAIPWSKCVPSETMDALSIQVGAVAKYNREYCHAWCRHSDWGVAALARGDCDTKKTAFDEMVDTVAVGEWCREAVATHTFDLVANYSGVAPYANLKGADACDLGMPVEPHTLVVTSMLVGFLPLSVSVHLK